ncbi:C39 family peptidase [Luteolibacter flavescens]|uniref:C39 family peptidase n=1 Tax=Luteolibacter flavescens TaxID=1859460 RepID=A0ABT3FHS9_9BACT|nr:C39 family peptidase [Luteolibacter flavescens]
MKLITPLLLAVSLLGPLQADEKKNTPRVLDDVIFDENLWTKSLEDVRKSTNPPEKEDKDDKKKVEIQDDEDGDVEIFLFNRGPKYMEWLSSDKDGLRSEPGLYQMLGKKVGEVVIRGREGNASDATISLFNRGDDGEITLASYQTKLKEWKDLIDEKMAVRSEVRNQQGAVPLEGWMWKKGDTAVLLEGSMNRSSKRAEFIRLRLTSISAAKNAPTKMARRTSFANNVKKDDKGFTWVEGVPMVDQGQKGYCVVASVERVARYFGAEIDQHEMAQLANTDDHGTSGDEMEKAFQRVTGKIHLRTLKHIEYDDKRAERDLRGYNSAAKKAGVKTIDIDTDNYYVDPRQFWFNAHKETFRDMKRGQQAFAHFERKVKEYVDQGIPLCWTLYLGMFKEKGLPQSYGGHMRLIIGYNFTSADPGEHKIYYTDSWGSGHEKKEMRADEAYCMTMALYSMVPNK